MSEPGFVDLQDYATLSLKRGFLRITRISLGAALVTLSTMETAAVAWFTFMPMWVSAGRQCLQVTEYLLLATPWTVKTVGTIFLKVSLM